jgi:hypothetical protein
MISLASAPALDTVLHQVGYGPGDFLDQFFDTCIFGNHYQIPLAAQNSAAVHIEDFPGNE